MTDSLCDFWRRRYPGIEQKKLLTGWPFLIYQLFASRAAALYAALPEGMATHPAGLGYLKKCDFGRIEVDESKTIPYVCRGFGG